MIVFIISRPVIFNVPTVDFENIFHIKPRISELLWVLHLVFDASDNSCHWNGGTPIHQILSNNLLISIVDKTRNARRPLCKYLSINKRYYIKTSIKRSYSDLITPPFLICEIVKLTYVLKTYWLKTFQFEID